VDPGAERAFKGFYALAAFLLGQLAKLRLNGNTGMRQRMTINLSMDSYAPPKQAFLTSHN
jgi:hypothetical protein